VYQKQASGWEASLIILFVFVESKNQLCHTKSPILYLIINYSGDAPNITVQYAKHKILSIIQDSEIKFPNPTLEFVDKNLISYSFFDIQNKFFHFSKVF
jgi:hypothetical protein